MTDDISGKDGTPFPVPRPEKTGLRADGQGQRPGVAAGQKRWEEEHGPRRS